MMTTTLMVMVMTTTTIKMGLSGNQNINTINRKAKVIRMQEAFYRHSRNTLLLIHSMSRIYLWGGPYPLCWSITKS